MITSTEIVGCKRTLRNGRCGRSTTTMDPYRLSIWVPLVTPPMPVSQSSHGDIGSRSQTSSVCSPKHLGASQPGYGSQSPTCGLISHGLHLSTAALQRAWPRTSSKPLHTERCHGGASTDGGPTTCNCTQNTFRRPTPFALLPLIPIMTVHTSGPLLNTI